MIVDCPAEVKVFVYDEESLKANVTFSGFICHHSKRHKESQTSNVVVI